MGEMAASKKVLGISQKPLSISLAPDATITRFWYSKITKTFDGAAYDSQGAIISLSTRQDDNRPGAMRGVIPEHLPVEERPVSLFQEEAIYLGHMMAQYGHFLIETLSTFWALKYLPRLPIIMHPFIFGYDIPSYMVPIFEVFGIQAKDIIIVKKNIRIGRLIVPERGAVLNCYFNIEHANTLRRIKDALNQQTTKNFPKVFVSRTRLQANTRSMQNSVEFDAAMEEMGFFVCHPQEMTLSEQISLFSSAKVLCGFSGSALHNVLFMERRTAVIELGDRRFANWSGPAQKLCNQLAGVTGFHVPFASEGMENIEVPTTIAKISQICESLEADSGLARKI